MKTMTLTAVLAVLVAIPLILKKKRHQLALLESDTDGETVADEARRYSIDDFLT